MMRKFHFKKYIKLFIPPVFILGFEKFMSKKIAGGGATFMGKFASFDDFFEKNKMEANYYWPGAVEQERHSQKKRMSQWGSESPPSGTFRTNFLPTLLSLFPEHKIHVLDIGGGLDNVFEYLKFSLRNKEINVTVLDQSPTVRNGKELYAKRPDAIFVEELPDDATVFDVIYFGSSIQYFPDYRQLLAQVIRFKPQLLVISDSIFGPSKTFVCAQVNMPSTTIPYTVINKLEIEEFVLENGYELIHQSINGNHFDLDAYGYPINLSRSWNLVFKKSIGRH